jgi:transcription termination/antitermination protein NusA
MATTTNPLQQTIEALAKEKGIDPQVVITAIEEAVATASRKYYKTNENLKTRFNLDTGQIELFAVKTVVETVENPATELSLDDARALYKEYGEEAAAGIEIGDEIEFPKPTDVLGRIAAQTAKQVIFQKVREAERENVHAEFSQRVGEVVGGTVKRFENGDIIVEMGHVESVLPRKEQSRAENYTTGDRVRAVIKAVNKSAKGPQVMLSRTDPALLIKLFEQEVPEIYDGTVMIRGAVREAGDRAKVAVYSRERDVDPVGACVGMKGTRVQAIIRELRGEKIDIVEWSEDSVQFVTNAISPAKVQRVSIVNEAERVMEVIVEDKQLSLAIGKKGQNVRLAAKLTGWKIDIKSEEEKRREVEAQFAGLEAAGGFALPGIEPSIIATLLHAGYDSPAKVADAEIADLAVLPGMDQDKAELTIAAARLTAVTGVSTEESEQAAPAHEPTPSVDEVALEATETTVEASADEVAVGDPETTTEAEVKETTEAEVKE